MFIENYWAGTTQYIITFEKGLHFVTESDGILPDEIIYCGHYAECREFVENLVDEYLDNLF